MYSILFGAVPARRFGYCLCAAANAGGYFAQLCGLLRSHKFHIFFLIKKHNKSKHALQKRRRKKLEKRQTLFEIKATNNLWTWIFHNSLSSTCVKRSISSILIFDKYFIWFSLYTIPKFFFTKSVHTQKKKNMHTFNFVYLHLRDILFCSLATPTICYLRTGMYLFVYKIWFVHLNNLTVELCIFQLSFCVTFNLNATQTIHTHARADTYTHTHAVV